MTSAPTGQLDFVVAGAQRAGSTHLAACLASHPDIHLEHDEVPYFEDPFYGNSSPESFAAIFRQALPGQRRGIHRPESMAKPEVAARIHAYDPTCKVIVVLRDPVARAVSAYHWYVQYGLLPLEPIDVGLRRLLDGAVDDRYPRGGDVLTYGLYGEQLARVVEVFGASRVMVLDHDDLALSTTFPSVFRFLGVSPDHEPPAQHEQKNSGVYEPRRLRFLRWRGKLAYSWDKAEVYEYRPRRRRRPLASAVGMVAAGVDRVILARVFGDPGVELEEGLKGELTNFYAADQALLTRVRQATMGPEPARLTVEDTVRGGASQ